MTQPAGTMDAIEPIVARVQKLLRLSTSSNAHEAALAAAKARAIIDRHHLTHALLALEADQPVADEPIFDFQKRGAPLLVAKRLERWRTSLASTIAKWNACKIYLLGPSIQIIG